MSKPSVEEKALEQADFSKTPKPSSLGSCLHEDLTLIQS